MVALVFQADPSSGILMGNQKTTRRCEEIAMKVSQKVYEQRKQIAQDIAKSMKKDGLEWVKPFSDLQLPRNGVSGRQYNGRNIAHLFFVAKRRGYTDPRWFTWNQAKGKGYRVKKDSKSVLIEKWGQGSVKVGENDDGTEIFARIPVFQKAWNCFNAEQLEGIDEWSGRNVELDDGQTVLVIERLLASSRCPVKEGGDEAYYSVNGDEIRIPSRHLYAHDGSASAFLRVLLHEMSHSTGKPLGRELKNKFGSAEYAYEELVAELSCLFTASALGFSLDFTDMGDEFSHRHVAYIQHWAQHITDNPDVLFQTVGKASKASDMLLERYYRTPAVNAGANL